MIMSSWQQGHDNNVKGIIDFVVFPCGLGRSFYIKKYYKNFVGPIKFSATLP